VKYVVAMDCDETSIVVYQEEEPNYTVTINLTCPAIRETTAEGMLTSCPEDETQNGSAFLTAYFCVVFSFWCFDTVVWTKGMASRLNKAGCCFFGGDSLIETSRVL